MSDFTLQTYAAVDIETSDPYLKKWGSGAIRKLGSILGVGIYCPAWNIDDYLHPDDPIVDRVLSDPNLILIMHNGVYDANWLVNGYGFKINGRIEDTMTRETLLDAYALSYSLEASCARRGVAGKNKGETIDEWWKQHGGKGKAIEHLEQIPFDVVGKYCKQDCHATYDLYFAQQPLLESQDLLRVNDIEARLYPFLLKMMGTGVRLNWLGRCELSDKLNKEYDELYEQIRKLASFDINIASNRDLEQLWRAQGIPIEYTEKGSPSFKEEVMSQCSHPLAKQISHMKALGKCLNTFVDGSFVDRRYEGRMWSTFYPAKRDSSDGMGGGTVTGRWSSQDINLQQIPARGDKWGKEIRSLFIPEEGCYFGAFDYKQIEYRVYAHFAVACGVDGSAFVEQAFKDNPDLDYHAMGQHLMGWDDMGKEGRHLMKNLGFGSLYGLGPKSFARKFREGLLHSHPDADPDNLVPLAASLQNEYYEKVPFVKPLQRVMTDLVQKRGYIKTPSGRRQRNPTDGKTYKIVNYECQGTAADILKKGVVDAWDKGVFNVLTPHMVVHDEVDFSIPKTKEGYEACEELKRCMANAYQLRIPIGVDTEIGSDWGHCDEDTYKAFEKEVMNG